MSTNGDAVEQGMSVPEWKTSDYYLASFLIAKGIKIISVEGSRPRMTFVLYDPNPSERESLMLGFRIGEDEVSANELFSAQKQLQRMMRDRERDTREN
jgi:hypothetical protein